MRFCLVQMLLVTLAAQVKGQSGECIHGEVTLVDGSNSTEGRVEVCFNGYWGTVCDDSWTYQDAQVVCKQLGYPYSGATAIHGAYYGAGNGLIHMDEVQCTGDEDYLFNCTFIQDHDCSHYEDASVECVIAECVEGDVRLVGGLNETEGRVEVCLGGRWGTVCDDSWTYQDAQVVCKQLGYPYSGATAIHNAHYGAGNGLIHMDEVQCTGDEDHLFNCTFIQDHDCSHYEDASVQCVIACSEGDVRLVGGMNETEGRVEICLGGRWGTVCDDSWTYQDAQVVCRQLGYPYSGARAIHDAYYGAGNRLIHIGEVQCTGDEDYLINCTFIQNHYCWEYEDASVECVIACTEGDVRLVGGMNETEGRVEVCLGGRWGTVCDDSWTYQDAQVVCRQLGYPYSEARALSDAHYGAGNGLIHMDEVQCTGDEDYLLNCAFIQDHNCGHYEDASVQCVGAECIEGKVRLTEVLNETTEGLVEVCLGGTWRSICGDYWDENDARVVCRQLGHKWSGAIAYTQVYFDGGSGPISLDCSGSEDSILDCNYDFNNSSCTHNENAGIMCANAQKFPPETKSTAFSPTSSSTTPNSTSTITPLPDAVSLELIIGLAAGFAITVTIVTVIIIVIISCILVQRKAPKDSLTSDDLDMFPLQSTKK